MLAPPKILKWVYFIIYHIPSKEDLGWSMRVQWTLSPGLQTFFHLTTWISTLCDCKSLNFTDLSLQWTLRYTKLPFWKNLHTILKGFIQILWHIKNCIFEQTRITDVPFLCITHCALVHTKSTWIDRPLETSKHYISQK